MWLNLLIDADLPICGNSSPHGSLANDGDRNIVDSVDWIVSEAWRGVDGKKCSRCRGRARSGDLHRA
jgi:hypothetical protein